MLLFVSIMTFKVLISTISYCSSHFNTSVSVLQFHFSDSNQYKKNKSLGLWVTMFRKTNWNPFSIIAFYIYFSGCTTPAPTYNIFSADPSCHHGYSFQCISQHQHSYPQLYSARKAPEGLHSSTGILAESYNKSFAFCVSAFCLFC